jgi:hypothetical protein
VVACHDRECGVAFVMHRSTAPIRFPASDVLKTVHKQVRLGRQLNVTATSGGRLDGTPPPSRSAG